MPGIYGYDISVVWTGNRGTGTSGYRAYSREHDVNAGGRPVIAGSSEPLFRGDPARWNPELELTAALSQCHMLWYLHLCAAAGVTVISYTDNAHGSMTETADGSGHFTEVVLRPQVAVASPDMVEGRHEPAQGSPREVLHRELGELPGPAPAGHHDQRRPCHAEARHGSCDKPLTINGGVIGLRQVSPASPRLTPPASSMTGMQSPCTWRVVTCCACGCHR